MSRIGRKPITVPANVEVTIDGQHVRVKGPRGELERTLHRDMIIERHEGHIHAQGEPGKGALFTFDLGG